MITYSFSDIGSDSLYEHLYKCIKNDIINGTLSAGTKLPSKRSFARNLGISTITVENAYQQLIAEGYVFSVQKKGYYVCDIDEDSVLRSGGTGRASAKTAPQQAAPSSEPRYHQAAPAQGKRPHPAAPPTHTVDLQALTAQGKRPDPTPRPTPKITADLTSTQTAPQNFPFAVWARLLRSVISEQREELMTPSPSAGTARLRRAICAHLRAFRGMNAAPEQIIIGAGTEYLYTLLIQLLGAQRVYAVEDPGYRKISKIYGSHGVKCCHIPLDAGGVATAELEASGADILHISPSHHFPTGIVTPISRRYELLAWAAKSDSRYIIEDDYDSEFRLEGRPIPTLSSIDVMEKVIYMNTFSKSLTPTIRISYMVLPEHLVRRFYEQLSFYSCTVSNFEQLTLARFIDEGYFEKHINRMRTFYRNRRDEILQAIAQSPLAQRVRITEEDAGLHFLMKIDTKLTEQEFRREALSRGIRLAPLSDYYDEPSRAPANTYIINYSDIDQEQLNKAINALNAAAGVRVPR